MDCADPPSEDGTTMAPQASARKHGLSDDNNQSRQGKRGKYTSVACEECKKRKSKCIPAGESGCERCVEGRLVCIYTRAPPQLARDKAERSKAQTEANRHHEYRQSLHLAQQNQRIESLSSEVTQIRQQLADLTGAVNRLGEAKQALPGSLRPLSPAASQGATLVHSPTSHSRRDNVSQQPQFMGPTRPAFGLVMGERALTRMGIPVSDSVPPSGAQSPTTSSHDPMGSAVAREYWASCGPDEVRRLLEVWHDEVEMVYPFIDLRDQVSQSPELIERFRTATKMENQHFGVDARDIDLFKVALSTANVCDSGGKNDLSTAIVESVESNISRLSKSNTNLKSIQLLMMLSIYYFHSGEDLLSWRTIGLAAREALEMGLHRKESTLERFSDQQSRAKAARVFWCLYVLDRRWSFGAGLPFAISERDIDPDLPEPDAEFAYLRCMVNYGRLNSEIWDAIPPFGSGPQSIAEDTANSLEARALDWLESIPTELQLRHPRLGLAPQSQPAGLQRLRTLLYLRGNHARSLIHRNHILDGPSISGNLQGAWLVVDIAMDSIQVLMHLSATTDIYKRQQNAFNYFLLSALAIIVLAVCNAPEIFTAPCRKSFLDAVELVRGFSRHSNVSMRLWKTINGILPRLGRLGLQRSEGLSSSSTGKTPAVIAAPGQFGTNGPSLGHSSGAELEPYMPGVDPHSDLVSNANFMCESPDLSQMGTDLLSLFDAFGHRYAQPADYYSANAYALNDFDFLSEIGGEVSRRFEGLI